jgi:curved DNA-binding protein CbpA
MADAQSQPDYYEVLQVSVNADPETIHRIYRILAQRFHPDNTATGDAERFRTVTEAYDVLSNPERRAQYDVHYGEHRRERSQLLAEMVRAQNDVEFEQLARLTLLEALYARRRLDPRAPGIFDADLEELVGRPREHLEFTLWYLGQKGFIDRSDGSKLMITAQGVEYFEEHSERHQNLLRLTAAPEPHAQTVS